MASIYDQLTFNTLRNNQDTNLLPNNQNLGNNRNTNRYSGLEYGQQSFPDEEVVDETVTGINYPNLGNPLYPQTTQPRVPDWISSPNRPSLPEKTGINFPSIFGTVKGGLERLGDKFKRPDAKQAAYDAITGGQALGSGQWTRGNYGGNEYDLYNSPSGLKVGSEIIGRGEGYEKNFDSMFGSKSLEEMEQKKLEWALDRIKRGKSVHSRFRPELEARGMLDRIGDQRPGRTITDTVTNVTNPNQGASTYRGPPTTSFNRAQAVKAGSYDRTAGPMSGSYGPHSRRAEGGRIGYQEGELVEDEYMAEATPRGMMEENVEEVQGEPSREQLEAIALEIFRLPLEELNEEQLNVVYQAAMEQEPAEEEIQFAAQEGPGEGIASLV